MKIITVIGARPQFVKAAIVSRALVDEKNIDEILIHTGQHFDTNMSEIFFEELGIPAPKYNLGIGGGGHGANTGRMLEQVESLLLEEKPDLLLVYGDTDSTLAGALAAAKLSIPIAHIEAGLRSYNRSMPEEINRILTDHVADLLFTPSESASRTLVGEGIDEDKIVYTGDVMFDAVRVFSGLIEKQSTILSDLNLTPGSYVLSTVHRKENTDNRKHLSGIFNGLASTGENIILPLHPRTRKMIQQEKIAVSENISLIDPVGYLDMIALQANARLVATDSGGMQKEAYFLKVPCVTFRDETEWTELVDAGVNVLVGANPDKIVAAFKSCNFATEEGSIYGDGFAADKIADALSKYHF